MWRTVIVKVGEFYTWKMPGLPAARSSIVEKVQKRDHRMRNNFSFSISGSNKKQLFLIISAPLSLDGWNYGFLYAVVCITVLQMISQHLLRHALLRSSRATAVNALSSSIVVITIMIAVMAATNLTVVSKPTLLHQLLRSFAFWIFAYLIANDVILNGKRVQRGPVLPILGFVLSFWPYFNFIDRKGTYFANRQCPRKYLGYALAFPLTKMLAPPMLITMGDFVVLRYCRRQMHVTAVKKCAVFSCRLFSQKCAVCS